MNAKEAKGIADKVNGLEIFIQDVIQLIRLDCERGRYHTRVFCDSEALSRGAIEYFLSQGFDITPDRDSSGHGFTLHW